MRIAGIRPWVVVAALLAASVCWGAGAMPVEEPVEEDTGPAAADGPVQLKPGARFRLSFPDLVPDRRGQVSSIQVQLPASYDPAKRYPLLVYMGGGQGTNVVALGPQLADAGKFILVGMPHPKGGNDASFAPMVGDFPKLWAYQKVMLDRLAEVVPNINPSLRVASGYSNGGHAIDGCLRQPGGVYRQYYNVYIICEATPHPPGAYPRAPDTFMFVCWGDKSRARGETPRIADEGRAAGMTVQSVEMKNTGHVFNRVYANQARDWINQTVIPAVLKSDLARAEKAVGARPAEVLAAAGGLAVLADGVDADAQARLAKLIADVEKKAAAEFEPLRAGLAGPAAPDPQKPAFRQALAMARKYRGTKAAAEAETAIEPVGKARLDAIIAPLTDDAPAAKVAAAAAALKALEAEWDGTSTADRAREQRGRLGMRELEQVKAKWHEPMTPTQRLAAAKQVKALQTKWQGTAAAEACNKALGDLVAAAAPAPAPPPAAKAPPPPAKR